MSASNPKKSKPKAKPDVHEVGRAAPHAFFVKVGGKPVKNPHYIPAAKRKKTRG